VDIYGINLLRENNMIEGGFIEIVIGGEKKQIPESEAKYTKEEVCEAAETLMEAKNILADEELMPYVKGHLEQMKKNIDIYIKETKKIKPKSIDDLRKLANAPGEDSEEE
jgi:hypothetical protein